VRPAEVVTVPTNRIPASSFTLRRAARFLRTSGTSREQKECGLKPLDVARAPLLPCVEFDRARTASSVARTMCRTPRSLVTERIA
jgi:hypothetical protein